MKKLIKKKRRWLRMIGVGHWKAARYLNMRSSGWDRRQQLIFLNILCLLFVAMILLVLLLPRATPSLHPDIRQPPVRPITDSILPHFFP